MSFHPSKECVFTAKGNIKFRIEATEYKELICSKADNPSFWNEAGTERRQAFLPYIHYIFISKTLDCDPPNEKLMI